MPWWKESKVVVFLAVLIVGAIVVTTLALTDKLPDLTAEALGDWGAGLIGLIVGLFGGAAGAGLLRGKTGGGTTAGLLVVLAALGGAAAGSVTVACSGAQGGPTVGSVAGAMGGHLDCALQCAACIQAIHGEGGEGWDEAVADQAGCAAACAICGVGLARDLAVVASQGTDAAGQEGEAREVTPEPLPPAEVRERVGQALEAYPED